MPGGRRTCAAVRDGSGGNHRQHGHHTAEERALLNEHIIAFRFEGPLFFGGAHSALLELAEVSDIRVASLRLSHVTTLDATGAAVLSDTIRSLENRGITVLVSGLPQQFTARLGAMGILAHLPEQNHVFAHPPPDAIAHARRHVARDGHHLATWSVMQRAQPGTRA